jgi:iron(III) transport system substrate-binding protein
MISRLIIGLLSLVLAIPSSFAAEVNLYSARKEALIKPLLDKFTEKTGVTVNLITGKADALLKRLQSEGKNSPADLFLTTDAGRLQRAKNAKVLTAVASDILNSNIPAQYRDDDNFWYGLSLRARVILYDKVKVKPEELSTYEALSDEKWKKSICIRSSSNIYNQSLVASLIVANGSEKTEAWATGLVANMARKPAGGDRDQIKAVAAGQCKIAVANTYYLGKMLGGKKADQKAAAEKVAVFWPNQAGRGTHVNVSGIGLTLSAKNKDNAIKLMEYLSSDTAQAWYAAVNYEFPVSAKIERNEIVKSWGEFKADPVAMSKLGTLNPDAVKMMDRAGWK